MDSFNLTKLREYIPRDLPKPRMPSWPTMHTSMNPDDDEGPIALASGVQSASPISQRSPSSFKAAESAAMLTAPKPIKPGPKSNMDLVDECDNFPYYQSDPAVFFAHVNSCYGLFIKDLPDTELGYILPSVARVFSGLPAWKVDHGDRSLTLMEGSTEEERSRAVAMTCRALRATDHFTILRGWRDELYPVYGPKGELLFSIERSASALFGIVTYGCHMTAWTRSKQVKDGPEINPEDDEEGIWVPRRAKTKQTYGGMLDNSVAGGIATGEKPLDSMVREAAEEASLPAELVRDYAKSVGTVTYFHIRDERAGGETGLLQPECQFVYDLELPEDVVPRPSDDEVEGFELMGVEEVKERLRNGEFKPNCALVLLDFFIRHGVLTAEDEDYVEICSRLHRRLEFPTI